MDLETALVLLDLSSDEGALDDLILWHFENRTRISHPRDFRLENINEERCKELFRFNKEDIPRLVITLKMLVVLETPNRLKVNRLETLCIFFGRMAYPCRLSDVGELFGRHPADTSTIFKTVLNNIYDQHSQRLLTLNHPWLDVAALSESVVAIGSPLPRCFCFIDDTVRPIARPIDNKWECYNGHKNVHALKFQGVTLPNGIIGHVVLVFFLASNWQEAWLSYSGRKWPHARITASGA
ncbi:hypothetical protein ElyMa_004100500 [Elysia marginata]|uniref:DDE Tnp4 domain-containing protein n=1 Tax=Elysia marginata TaxID=1093978 RepID=A0AAV4GBX6_9GAST|nr:hypothetical protein ElyMa_004100500 [Elysia marginata]